MQFFSTLNGPLIITNIKNIITNPSLIYIVEVEAFGSVLSQPVPHRPHGVPIKTPTLYPIAEQAFPVIIIHAIPKMLSSSELPCLIPVPSLGTSVLR